MALYNFLGDFTYSDVLFSALILAAFVVTAKVAYFILKKYVSMVAAKTRTSLDDRLLDALESPVFLAIVSVGLYLALQSLTILNPYSAYLDSAYYALLIAIGAYFFSRVGDVLLSWYSEDVGSKSKTHLNEIIPTIRNIWRVITVVVAGTMILGSFGVEISPLLASLGIAGLAVALALQDTLSNFFAGVYLTADRPIKGGDYIKLESGEDGYVVKVGWRSTKIRTLKNNIVVVPNFKLSQSILTNYYSPDKQMAVVLQCSVAYGTDLKKAEAIVIDVATKIQKSVKGAVKDFVPFTRYHTFGDNGIGFSIILRVEEYVDQYLVTHEFIKTLSKRFGKEGIEIPYPKRSIYVETFPKTSGK